MIWKWFLILLLLINEAVPKKSSRGSGGVFGSRRPGSGLGGKLRNWFRKSGFGGRPSVGRPSGGTQYGGRPYGGRPYGGTQYGKRPYGGRPYGGTQYGGRPYGGRPYGGTQYGGSPYGGRSYGGRTYVAGGYPQRPPTIFQSGSGPGSFSSGNSFRNALIGSALGAIGGMLAYDAGKAVIKEWTKPISYNNRDYYWDHHPKKDSNLLQCSITMDELQQLSNMETQTRKNRDINSLTSTGSILPTPSQEVPPEQVIKDLKYPNGTHPQRITWTCQNYEYCCGTDCCTSEKQFTPSSLQSVLILLAGLAIVACCCVGVCLMLKRTPQQDDVMVDNFSDNTINNYEGNYWPTHDPPYEFRQPGPCYQQQYPPPYYPPPYYPPPYPP